MVTFSNYQSIYAKLKLFIYLEGYKFTLKRRIFFLLTLTLVIGIIIGISFNASAQEQSIIPSWIKNTAKFWVNGDVSDIEFIKALQWLVDQKILNIPQSSVKQPAASQQPATQSTQPDQVQEGFSGTLCQRDESDHEYVVVTGKYTNGPMAYNSIFVRATLLDNDGNVLATGTDFFVNVDPYKTNIFDIQMHHSGDFAKCQMTLESRDPHKTP